MDKLLYLKTQSCRIILSYIFAKVHKSLRLQVYILKVDLEDEHFIFPSTAPLYAMFGRKEK